MIKSQSANPDEAKRKTATVLVSALVAGAMLVAVVALGGADSRTVEITHTDEEGNEDPFMSLVYVRKGKE